MLKVVQVKEGGKQGCLATNPADVQWIDKHDMWSEEKCEKIWGKAEKAIKKAYKTNTIHRVMKEGKYCYNPQIYSKKGWCKMADDEYKWGICSESCSLEVIKVSNYHSLRFTNSRNYNNAIGLE